MCYIHSHLLVSLASHTIKPTVFPWSGNVFFPFLFKMYVLDGCVIISIWEALSRRWWRERWTNRLSCSWIFFPASCALLRLHPRHQISTASGNSVWIVSAADFDPLWMSCLCWAVFTVKYQALWTRPHSLSHSAQQMCSSIQCLVTAFSEVAAVATTASVLWDRHCHRCRLHQNREP